ncbi:hypothetical protein M3G43_13625 [Brevibacterium casei]|uniref:hypothetical protein n=1 Tax=Brevibacterium casei TaxID=33889 RepID=UPI00223B9EA6|nr:hypothetical protein [Brevibacterium casei]MCT1448293.1 hypothetical protein [Brevibacterium casei]
MTVGYRSILTLNDHEDAIKVANEQFHSWLMEMVRDPRKSVDTAHWEGPGVTTLGPESVLTVVEHSSNQGHLRRLLLEYAETTPTGKWTTRLYAVSAPESRRLKEVLWFESEGEGPDGTLLQPGTPRIVRNTLETVDAFDVDVPILSKATGVRSDGVDELIDHIENPQRDISIVIAAPIPGVPPHQWISAVSSLTRDSIGCASFYVLDSNTVGELNARLGPSHEIPAGALRTFVPRAELGDWADARRHRILTARTLAENLRSPKDPKAEPRFSERLIHTVAVSPRLHVLEASLPTELTRTARVLQRERLSSGTIATSTNVQSVQTFTPEYAPPADRPEWYAPLARFIKRATGIETVDEKSIESLSEVFDLYETSSIRTLQNASKLQDERERLEDQVNELRRQLEYEQFERELAEITRRDAEKKVRALEHWRADRSDSYTFHEDPQEPWDVDPASVADIVERLTDPVEYKQILEFVELTDPEKAIDRAYSVDVADPNGTYASSFWEYILILRDYVIERRTTGFSGSVHMYLNSTETRGRKCPAMRHKANESETVHNNPKMRRERTFPVPEGVDESGEVFMTAHFAPTHRDQNAPRMYYFDDYSNTGKVYVGYMGIHLSNTKTN